MKYTIGYKMSKNATSPLSSHLHIQEKMIADAMANAMYSHPSFVMFIVIVLIIWSYVYEKMSYIT